MSLIAQTLQLLTAGSRLIGPGRLVLVVGPSGSGKDTLIAGARAACRADGTVVFPRRVVTRPPSPAEDNDVLSPPAFAEAAARGDFALFWNAHGHDYGIPATIDRDIQLGRTVVCNVSRTIVAAARRRYLHVVAVLVSAPPDILASRLAARGRSSDGGIAERLKRIDIAADTFRPDVIIDNVDVPESGIRKLVDTLYATGVMAT
jgi:ribose 1,5-bisphosphokinase